MSSPDHRIFEFGIFRLDTAERLLLRNGEPIQLAPKVFDTLVVLLHQSGHLIPKDQLMKAVWPDTFVEEVNLAVNISTLRKVLGDSENGRPYIETVSKRGYRFVAPIRNLASHEPAIHQHLAAGSINEAADVIPQTSRNLGIGARAGLVSGAALNPRRRRRNWITLLVVLLSLGVLVAGFGIYRLGARRPKAGNSFEAMRMAGLTNSGNVVTAAISADGKYIAYAQAVGEKQSLWLRQVFTASNVQIVPPTNTAYTGIIFSNDGNSIYYLTDENQVGVLYRMPVLGGTAKRLTADVDGLIAMAPDGQRFGFLRADPGAGESSLFVSRADGTGELKVATRKSPDFFSVFADEPSWSPDGRIIACPGGRLGDSPFVTVLAVRVESGEIQPMTTKRWSRVGGIKWLPDGHGLIVAAREDESSPNQLWYLSYPDGAARRITNDLSNYTGVTVTADGTTLLTVRHDARSSIWSGPAADSAAVRPIHSGKLDGAEGLSWTPDGKIVYASRGSGKSDIWIMDQNGNNQRQLTEEGTNNWPSVSADGRYVVFVSDRAGTQNIWRMDIDGSHQRQLTSGGNELFPDCSPDNQSVVYLNVLDRRALFKVSIDGGQAGPLISKAASRPAVSPDGKLIACAYFDQPGVMKTALYSVTGGEPLKLLPFKDFNLRWTPDGRGLVTIDAQGSNLVEEPIDGQPLKQLTDFNSDLIFRFAFSRDGKQLALVRGDVSSDAVLITNFR